MKKFSRLLEESPVPHHVEVVLVKYFLRSVGQWIDGLNSQLQPHDMLAQHLSERQSFLDQLVDPSQQSIQESFDLHCKVSIANFFVTQLQALVNTEAYRVRQERSEPGMTTDNNSSTTEEPTTVHDDQPLDSVQRLVHYAALAMQYPKCSAATLFCGSLAMLTLLMRGHNPKVCS